MHYFKLIKDTRQSIGLTQAELASRSGISFPAIQKIESGNGNPGYSTLESIFKVLGLKIKIFVESVDWDFLVQCGLPLTATKLIKLSPNLDILVECLRKAFLELGQQKERGEGSYSEDNERKTEALYAMLLAIKLHYPSIYQKYFGRSQFVAKLLSAPISGRVIKLKRQALAVLSTYL